MQYYSASSSHCVAVVYVRLLVYEDSYFASALTVEEILEYTIRILAAIKNYVADLPVQDPPL